MVAIGGRGGGGGGGEEGVGVGGERKSSNDSELSLVEPEQVQLMTLHTTYSVTCKHTCTQAGTGRQTQGDTDRHTETDTR